MARIIVEEQKDLGVLPEDSIIHIKVDEVDVKEVNGSNGPWTKVEFTFKIMGVQATGDGSPVEDYDEMVGSKIWGGVPFKLTDSAENKLRLWAEAILNMPLGVGYELDTDHFIGRQCRAVTRQYDKKKINEQTGKPFRGQGIDSLLPLTGGSAAAQAASPQGWSAQNPPQAGNGAWGTPSQQQGPPAADPWGATDEPPF